MSINKNKRGKQFMKTLLEVVKEVNENFMVPVKLGGSNVIKKAMEKYIEKIVIFLEEKNGKEFMVKYQEKINVLDLYLKDSG